MKNILKLFALVAVVCSAFGLSACNEKDDGGTTSPDHVHFPIYKDGVASYRGDATSHWLVCESCGEKFGEFKHDDKTAVCDVCDYKFFSEGLRFTTVESGTAWLKESSVTDAEVYIPDTYDGHVLTRLAAGFKGNDKITGVRIPDTVTQIYGGVFTDCTALKTVILPSKLEMLGDGVFKGCTSLESLVIPASVESVSYDAFKGCTSLKSVTFESGSKLTEISSSFFEGCESLEKISLPDGITSINRNAFKDCSKLTEAVLPDGVERIGHYAFAGCAKLENLNLPESVTDVGIGFLDGCGSLKLHESGNALFLGNETNPCVALVRLADKSVTDYFGEEKYRFICDGAFKECLNLKEVTVRLGVVSIGAGAFAGCTALEKVILFEEEGYLWWFNKLGLGQATPISDPEKNAENLTGEYVEYALQRSEN